MQPFDFHSVPAIRSEWGAAARLGAILAERFAERRVLLVTDRTLLAAGVGGGSSLDVAKLAAVLLRSDQPLGEMYGIGRVRGRRAPLVLVPTTAGTGSEVTNISIVTTGETAKAGIVARQLFADLAILDAEPTTEWWARQGSNL